MGLLNLDSPLHNGGGGGERLSLLSSFVTGLAAPAHCGSPPNNHDSRVWGVDFFWESPPPSFGRSISMDHDRNDGGVSAFDLIPLFASEDFIEDGRFFMPRGAEEREAQCVCFCEDSPAPDGGGGGGQSISSTSIERAVALVPCGSFPNNHDSKFEGVDCFPLPPP